MYAYYFASFSPSFLLADRCSSPGGQWRGILPRRDFQTAAGRRGEGTVPGRICWLVQQWCNEEDQVLWWEHTPVVDARYWYGRRGREGEERGAKGEGLVIDGAPDWSFSGICRWSQYSSSQWPAITLGHCLQFWGTGGRDSGSRSQATLCVWYCYSQVSWWRLPTSKRSQPPR